MKGQPPDQWYPFLKGYDVVGVSGHLKNIKTSPYPSETETIH